VEANTSHTPAVTTGRLNALLGSRRAKAAAQNGRVDETTARFDHYLRDSSAIVLHHRRLPGTRNEVSHLVVGPAGVTVVDSRRYNVARVKIDGRGGRATVRARADLAKHVLRQVDAVRELLAGTPYEGVPIEAAVARCKVKGPRVLQGLNAPRVIVSGVRTIAVEASRDGELDAGRVRSLAHFLDDALQ
jgi:hypothetical protein